MAGLFALASASDSYKNARHEAANLPTTHNGPTRGAVAKCVVAIQALAWYMNPPPTSCGSTFNHTCHSLQLTYYYAPKFKIGTQGSGASCSPPAALCLLCCTVTVFRLCVGPLLVSGVATAFGLSRVRSVVPCLSVFSFFDSLRHWLLLVPLLLLLLLLQRFLLPP